MKIVFLNYYGGLVQRGAETYVHNLANNLSLKNDIFVFQSGPELSNSKYSTYPKPTLRNLNELSAFTIWAIEKINQIRPDVVIPVNNGDQVRLISGLKHALKFKLVISSQSGMGRWGPGKDEWLNTLFNVDKYVMLTHEAQRRFRVFAPWQSTVVIPNGVDVNVFNPKVNPVKTKLAHPIVICVAALSKPKRVEFTVKAVSKTNASLLLVGKGTLQQENNINELASKLIPNRFLLTHADHNAMPGYYAAGDAFTLVSESSEAFGIAYLEALATNLPVVATDDNQRREILGDVGTFVNPQNIDEYARKIKLALGKDWGDAPRQRAMGFDWKVIANQYQQLFNSL